MSTEPENATGDSLPVPPPPTVAKVFHFEDLSPTDRVKLLDDFSQLLERFLKEDNFTQEKLFAELSKGWSPPKIDPKQFNKLLRHLHRNNSLKLTFHTDTNLTEELKRNYKDLHEVTVVSGSIESNFARAGAEEFVRQLVLKQARAAVYCGDHSVSA